MTANKPGKGAGLTIRNSTAEFLIFTHQAGESGINVRHEDNTIWLNQKLMAELFDVDKRTISEHLKNIFASGELLEDSVVRNFRTTAADGKNYQTQHYNLDAIISVGYRVNSVRATQFRQWATQVLREFAVKGYVLDKKRLENGTFLGEDHYERLLALRARQKAWLRAQVISSLGHTTKLGDFLKQESRPEPKPTEPYWALGIRSHGKGTFQRFVKDPASVDMEELYAVNRDNLIVNITFAWEGAIAFVKPEDERCLVSHRFPTYEVNNEIADPVFVKYIVNCKAFFSKLALISPSSTKPRRSSRISTGW